MNAEQMNTELMNTEPANAAPANAEILAEPPPGALGRVVELHARYYAQHWGFGRFFEAKVAAEMAEFAARLDSSRDLFLTVVKNGRVQGSLIIDGAHADSAGAHLRWFILGDALRGQGFGQRLMAEALAFCESRRYRHIYLWTFAGLDAARSLYDRAGFDVAEERVGRQWGTEVTEQRLVRQLG